MKIGVVIPALNEAAIIEATIRQLAPFLAGKAQICVADGGSTDATVALAERAGARAVIERGGRGAQQNAGVAALGDVDALLFLHADTVLPPGWQEAIERVLAEGAALGAFRLSIPGHSVIAFGANVRSRFLGLPYGDQALFMRRATFEALGGFRPLPIMEDFDLVRRVRRLGPVRIAKAAVITSNRRWRRRGAFRTTIVNQLVLFGWALGVSPARLASFYRR